MPSRPLSIYSWNVNGIRAACGKGFSQWFMETQPDVLGIQEVRATEEQLPERVRTLEGHRTHFVSALRKGYSGVGLFAREFDAVELSFESLLLDDVIPLGSRRKTPLKPKSSFDEEGRLQSLRLGNLLIVNGYFPNGNGKNRDNSRVPFKIEFYERLRAYLEPEFRAGSPILVLGDWNTAHWPVDLARPKQNKKTSGFLPQEREALDTWIEAGWVDSFRHFHPVEPGTEQGAPGTGHYTWWSQRFGVREKNIGWRIDYILASPGAVPYLKKAGIHPEVRGSDHCPISVEMDPSVMIRPRKR